MKSLLIAAFFIYLTGPILLGQDFEKNTDAYIQYMVRSLSIKKGIAVAVVKDGEVIFQKPYGYRDTERQLPVEKNTPFYIASTTKPFLAITVLSLVEEGLLDLDKPIDNYLPELRFLSGEISTDEITLRHLLSHTANIRNTPVDIPTYATGEQDYETLLHLFSYSKPEKDNISFSYTNIGYILAGLIIEKVTGKNWQTQMHERVLKPLEMSKTSSYVSDYSNDELAQPHSTINDEVVKITYLKNDKTMHAAGGLISTTDDLCKWLGFIMDTNNRSSQSIVSGHLIKEALKPQTYLSASFYDYHRFAYGLGWYHADFEGQRLIHHFGGLRGFSSHISFMPDHRIGVVVLSNGRGFRTISLVANYIYEVLLKKEDAESKYRAKIDAWSKSLRERPVSTMEEMQSEILDPNVLNELPGQYYNPFFGTIQVSSVDYQLNFKMGSLNDEGIFDSHSTFEVDWVAFEVEISIIRSDEGEIKGILVDNFEGEEAVFIRN